MHNNQDRRTHKKKNKKNKTKQKPSTRTSFPAEWKTYIESKTTTLISYHLQTYFKIDHETKRSWYSFSQTANQFLSKNFRTWGTVHVHALEYSIGRGALDDFHLGAQLVVPLSTYVSYGIRVGDNWSDRTILECGNYLV